MKKILILFLLTFCLHSAQAQNELSTNDSKRAYKLHPKCIPPCDSLEYTQFDYNTYIIGLLECTYEDKIYLYRGNDWVKIEIITNQNNKIMPNRKNLYIDGIVPNGNTIDIFIKQFICNDFGYCEERKFWYSFEINNKTKIADFLKEISSL